MPQVIGRVVTGTFETVRGPDVIHRLLLPRDWLLAGETVEFELPRNLTCVACSGGGCDRCDRSGAITLRARGEPVETIQLTLPKRTPAEISDQPSIVLRLPGQGGKDRFELEETRGLLLLKISVGEKVDPQVRRVRTSWAPFPKRQAQEKTPSVRSPRGRWKKDPVGVLAAAVVLGWIAGMILLGASLP